MATLSNERRENPRIQLHMNLATPVLVRGEPGLQRGMVRNISERGMLVELAEVPPIGSAVEITIAGVHGSLDAPESLTLYGEVRHQLMWQHQKGLRAVGIRLRAQPTSILSALM